MIRYSCGMLRNAAFLKFIVAISIAWSAVPATYKGKPYKGTPKNIPGRIDFEDYDLGGVNVAWKTDNKAGFAGSSAATRAGDGETEHPGFYITNNNAGEAPDVFADGSFYPSATNKKSIYIGATHATDWANVTVNVQKAGTYWVSSHFAADETQIKFHLSFNGVNKTAPMVTLTSVKNFHQWKFFQNCAKVQLDSGVQVMQFYVDHPHVNWDYISFSADSSNPVGIKNAAPVVANEMALHAVSAEQKELQYTLTESGYTTISAFNSAGEKVKQFYSGEQISGIHSVYINLAGLDRGVYFLQLHQKNTSKVLRFENIK